MLILGLGEFLVARQRLTLHAHSRSAADRQTRRMEAPPGQSRTQEHQPEPGIQDAGTRSVDRAKRFCVTTLLGKWCVMTPFPLRRGGCQNPKVVLAYAGTVAWVAVMKEGGWRRWSDLECVGLSRKRARSGWPRQSSSGEKEPEML